MIKKSSIIFFSLVILLVVQVPILQSMYPNLGFMKAQFASATGSITLNNVQSTSGTLSSSPYQITISNFNAGTGTNRLLVVGVEANNQAVSSITFGGVGLTREVKSFHNNEAAFWYLVNPSGTGNIVVTMNGATSVVVGAYAFSGVDQTTPVPTNATNYNTSSSSPTISITTSYQNSWVLDSPAIYGGKTLGSPTCTQQWDVNIPSAITGASSSHSTTSPGSYTCSWTANPSGDFWDDVAIEIKASGSTTPSAPLNPTAPAISTSQLQLKWNTPSSNGGSPITGYQVQKASNSWTTIVNNTGTTTTNYNVTSLASNSKYTYRIAAWNGVGLGAWSTNDTNSTVSGSPTSLTATGISSSQINISWTAPSGNATISGYKIERSTDNGNTWSTLVANTGSSNTVYSDTGLSQGTFYTYRVSAINSGGTSTPSNNASPPQWFDIFATPSSLTVQRNSSGTSTITLYGTYGFNKNVNLSLLSPPKGVTGSFSPSPVLVPTTGQVTSTLTINTNSSVPIGTQNITVLGQSGSVTNETSISLTITNPPSWHSSTGIVEPLYCNPYDKTGNPSTCTDTSTFKWNAVNNTKNQYPHVPIFVIVNPSSGVGSSKDPDYVKGIANLTKSGVIVLGYEATSKGHKLYSTVTSDIDTWVNWYGGPNGIKGIELDEMTNNPGINNANVTYYQNITNYIHSKGLKYSFGNPGAGSQPVFQGSVDLMNIYEGSTAPSNSTDLQGSSLWHTWFDKSTFRFEQYEAASLPSQSVIRGYSVYDGYMFFTNDGADGNPWDSIPSYLGTLTSYLNNTSVLSGLYAQDTSNNPLTARILITQSGNQVRNSTTPFNYNETSGWQFVLNPQNSCPGYTFDHWLDTGSTTASRTIAPTVNTNYTAVYRNC